MKVLLSIFLFLFSFNAFGAYFSKEVCFTDLNTCGIYSVSPSGSVVTIAITTDIGASVSTNVDAEFKKLGIYVVRVDKANYAKYRATNQVTQTRNTTVEQESNNLASISDESWNLFYSSAQCAGAALICGGSAFVSAETFGLSLFLARAACVGTGVVCIDTVRNYQKWEKYQKKMKDEQDKYLKEVEKGGIDPGPGDPVVNPPPSSPPPPPPGGIGGGFGGGGGYDDSCSYCTVKDIPDPAE